MTAALLAGVAIGAMAVAVLDLVALAIAAVLAWRWAAAIERAGYVLTVNQEGANPSPTR